MAAVRFNFRYPNLVRNLGGDLFHFDLKDISEKLKSCPPTASVRQRSPKSRSIDAHLLSKPYLLKATLSDESLDFLSIDSQTSVLTHVANMHAFDVLYNIKERNLAGFWTQSACDNVCYE